MSRHSNAQGGECVEVAEGFATGTWRTSSYSNTQGGECVEVAEGLPGVRAIRAVRDSKCPQGPILIASEEAWTAFVRQPMVLARPVPA
ncbi:hypothetical protein AT728_10635 [Streptomyces silvensis]|uniref:DUF397 domain-containing protein n=1 Tax=Streptomyces silvensis TaxID=1765722 RepID=A0A0W7X4V8_9ACTN|nr:hypothetical protein AT728_10635 [Streptomyces silvensis]